MVQVNYKILYLYLINVLPRCFRTYFVPNILIIEKFTLPKLNEQEKFFKEFWIFCTNDYLCMDVCMYGAK